MKRFLVLIAFAMWMVTFLVSKHNYVKTVEQHRFNLPSNIEIEEQVHSFEGRIISYDIVKNSMVFETKSPISNEHIRYRLLFKNQPELVSEILNHNYHFTINLDLNQNIFRSPKNLYGFDYDFFLFSQGIHGQFYVQDFSAKSIQKSCTHCSRLAFREMIALNLDERYSYEVSSFLKAILLGDRSDMVNYDTYKDMGLAHIFAISGLHFGLIYKLLQKLIKLPDRITKSILIMMFLFAFSFWIGPSYSAYRAFALIGYLEVARLLHRNPDVMTGIAFSSLVILTIRPVAILSQSFQLSFYAYFCVAVVYRTFFGNTSISRISRLFQSIKFSVVLQILLMPATLFYFHQINIYGFLANLFIVPLIGLILPVALIDLVSTMMRFGIANAILSCILSFLVDLMEKIIQRLPSELYEAEWFRPDDYGLLLCVFLFFVLLRSFYFDKGIKKYVLYSGITGIVILGLVCALPRNDLVIHFVDVGHGDFSVLNFKNRAVLIDTGDGYMDCADYLKDQGIISIDAIILSHAHRDHIGGLEKLIADYDIEYMYVNQETYDILKTNMKLNDMEMTLIDKPNKIYWNQVILDITPVNSIVDTNDNALVVKLEHNNRVGYFLGDISGSKIDVLEFEGVIDFVKVPHHGSKTSINESFYSDHTISNVIISHSMKYNMPNADVINLLLSNDVDIYTTYNNGSILLNINGDTMKLKSYLNDNP
ncbi:MAG: DNA internalization-related competence protein ComEC/Rec2 [Clostridia bacterium]|nr:DNA internalization-related competence protein ComEC/Rec2 [Clostridia bacterium]